MKNIKNFKTSQEFELYIFNNVIKDIGVGSEGTVYLSKSGEILKNMLYAFYSKNIEDYPDIIMADDLKLDSFIFPKELFLYGDRIIGYRSDYFDGNIFKTNLDNTGNIDIDNLVRAREKFIEDVKVLTKEEYDLFELPHNLLFDNNRLVAIDTLDYQKENVTLDHNIGTVDYAIALAISDYYDSMGINEDIDANMDFDTVIQKVKK